DKKLWESGNLIPSKMAGTPVDVDIRGVRELKLVARAEKDNNSSHMLWIAPRLTSAAQSVSQIDRLTSADYVWSDPESLGPTINASQCTRSPALTDDQLCLFVNRYGGANDQTSGLYEYRRQTVQGPWGAGVQVATDSRRSFSSLTADGLQLFTKVEWKEL